MKDKKNKKKVPTKPNRKKYRKYDQCQGLNREQTKVLQQIMQSSKKWTWQQISNVIHARGNRRLRPPIIKKQWIKMLDQQKPSKQQIVQYCYNLIDSKQRWFDYDDASLKISQGPFKFRLFAKFFMKRVYTKSIYQVQMYAKQVFQKQPLNLTRDEVMRTKDFLVTSWSRFTYLLTPEYLRYYLLSFYFAKLQQVPIKKSIILGAYYFLSKMKNGFICQKTKQVEQNVSKWSFKWTSQQLYRVFEQYCQHGKDVVHIAKTLLKQFGQKQNFNSRIIRSLLEKFQRNAMLKAKYFLKENDVISCQFKFNTTLCNASHFILDKNDEYFHISVKLMSIAFGKKYEAEEIQTLMNECNFIMKRSDQLYKKYNKVMSQVVFCG